MVDLWGYMMPYSDQFVFIKLCFEVDYVETWLMIYLQAGLDRKRPNLGAID